MRLSTRMRYGARAMVELGLAYADGPVSAREMAGSQRLSVKYLEHIMAALKAAGLVTPVHGTRGGYTLAGPPSSITLGDIFRVLEGPMAVVHCVEHPDACPMLEICPTRDTWVELTAAVKAVLEQTTLQDLVQRRRRRDRSARAMNGTSAAAGSLGAGSEEFA